jgi:hypothetical protein
MNEATARELIRDHLAWGGRDEARASRIYADDAVLEFPQGGERIRGKANIQAMRTAYPARLDFENLRTMGAGDVWVNQYTIRYDGRPSHVVGIMEFRDGLVVRETIYVSDSWEPPAWRAEWVEPIVPPAGQQA